MRSQILFNIRNAFTKKKGFTYTCFLCDPPIKLKGLKHLKFHNKKYHKNKIGIGYNRDDKN